MVCTVLHYIFITFRSCNCSINILLPVIGWGLTADKHWNSSCCGDIPTHSDVWPWWKCLEESVTEFYMCNNTSLNIWTLDLHSKKSMSIYHLIGSAPFHKLVIRYIQGYLYWNQVIFLFFKYFWLTVFLKYEYLWGKEASLVFLSYWFLTSTKNPIEAGNLYFSSISQ